MMIGCSTFLVGEVKAFLATPLQMGFGATRHVLINLTITCITIVFVCCSIAELSEMLQTKLKGKEKEDSNYRLNYLVCWL